LRFRVAGLLAAALVGAAALASACSYSVVVTPAPSLSGSAPALVTDRAIGATPWPNGTTGQYGLRIDPSLSSNVPSYVGGNPLQEDAISEALALDDPQYAAAFSALYVAQVGSIADLNWVEVSVAAVKGGEIDQTFYTSWRDDWFKTACSQADGIASTSQETINDWPVDLAACSGGVRAYTLSLDNGILVSIMDLGPRQLGRELIGALN
jgi:hypothetical protein